ncbi:MAG: pyridoxal phosphate-dependent aminotransferase [Chloroflexi bacterium]|nr:pyridoxal phosphate-dependent aminotransferase [Chloroflexota bacterium]
MKLAERMSRLGTESAFEVLAKAKALEAQGREVIHLEIGEPDFDTPPHIVEAACRALRNGATHYTNAQGIPELREAIAEHLGPARNQAIDPAQVVVTPGAKPIMFFVILALAEPGTEVIYPNPGFPIYESMINFVGAKPVPIPLREEKGFRFDIDEFRDLVTDRTRLVILNSPQNPTGGALEMSDLEAIADICRERDIPVLSDEVYEHILYDGEFHSIATLPGMSCSERTIILHGFSKTYAMTGWRLGYGVMPKDLATHITRLMVNSNSCTNAATQYAGIEALRGPQDSVKVMVDAFRQRRDVIVKGLNELPGVRCVMPAGAFYVFPNITGTGMTSAQCESFFMDKAGVACLSGAAFGQYGEGYLRLSYANSIENIQKALDRMASALASR